MPLDPLLLPFDPLPTFPDFAFDGAGVLPNSPEGYLKPVFILDGAGVLPDGYLKLVGACVLPDG